MTHFEMQIHDIHCRLADTTIDKNNLIAISIYNACANYTCSARLVTDILDVANSSDDAHRHVTSVIGSALMKKMGAAKYLLDNRN